MFKYPLEIKLDITQDDYIEVEILEQIVNRDWQINDHKRTILIQSIVCAAVALLFALMAANAHGATSAKWFRFIAKQKYAWSNSSTSTFRLSECALLDADGVQQGVGLVAVDPATDPADMAPGTCLVSTPYTTVRLKSRSSGESACSMI